MKTKGQANIAPLELEASLVVKSFELVHAGQDRPAEILRTMTEAGLRSRKGNKLTLNTFITMLRNPVYMGYMRSGKWGTQKGLHEPIVSDHTFRNVQLILKGKKPIAAPYQRNRADFPLRRFLRCSECDTPLTGGPSRSRTGRKYDYYRCYKCRAVSSLPAEKASAEFLELLDQLRVGSSFTTEFTALVKEEWATRAVDSTRVVRKLKAELQEKRESQEKLLTKYLNDDPNILPHFDRINRKLESDIAALENQIAEADLEKATLEDLLEFSRSILLDIPRPGQRPI
jgi:site-specific DNA recombinase